MARWYKINQDLALTASLERGDAHMHRVFLEKNGLTEWAFVYAGTDDIPAVLKAGCFPAGRKKIPIGGYSVPPYIDHARYYRGQGHALLVYHPYYEPWDIGDEVEAWGWERGLNAEAHSRELSWYYPGETSLVVIAPAGIEVVV